MIILYGGSFNPPTIAHYEISRYLLNKYNPKAFIFIPVGNTYNKSCLTDFSHRCEMLKIIASKLPNTEVSTFENQKQYKGTIATLEHFQNQYQNENLYYVIGADNLLSITKWIDYDKLLSSYRFIVLNRDDINVFDFIRNMLPLKYQSSFIIETDFPRLLISSSQYRNQSQDNIVLKEINDYIYNHHLYMR